MSPAERDALVDVAFTSVTTLGQAALLLHGMVRATRDDVPGDSFQNTWPLWAATLPVVGWLVARRRTGVVRALAMRLHAYTCAVTAVSIAWDVLG